ncbi:SDR family NAD(P)-dependent oxidoreductase [Salipaludibacillus sp. CF4.18]|uniref:SDR family NAD(P)-dependent oxidoreductase n=1 Tax=Salipaludibacillus sp. CF4.18 TaxID=3373081 RepID=UPI003EE4BE26
MQLSNYVALVTGGGSKQGIGGGIAKELAKEGATVIIGDINYDGAKITAKEISEQYTYSKVFPLQLDVTKQGEVKKKVKQIINDFDKIDVLVNNAGVAFSTKLEEIEEEEWDLVQNVNIKGVFFLTKEVATHMKENKYGRIINISSVAGKRGGGLFGGAHYAASKAALIGFSKTISRELAAYGITSNCVIPSWTNTQLTKDVPDETVKEIIKMIPVGRQGKVEDVANVVKFLSLHESSYITGEDIDVNGGFHID